MVSLYTLTVGDVMVKDVIVIPSDQTVKHAANVMSLEEIGCLVVVKEKNVVGIITEQDLIRRVIAVGEDPDKTLVFDVMSTPPVVVSPELSLEKAIRLMFLHKIKKLIVVRGDDGNKVLVGLVTLTDIARIEPLFLKTLKSMFENYSEKPPRRIEKVMNYYIV